MFLKKVVFYIVVIVFSSLSIAIQNGLCQANLTVEYNYENEEALEIKLILSGEKLKSVSNFPEIQDFVKGNTFFTKENASFYISQIYYPLKTGTFVMRPFNINVNGVKYSFKSQNFKIKNKKAVKENLVKHVILKINSEELIKPDVFFKINSNTKNAYTREGINLSADFYVAKNNTEEFNFVHLQEQVKTISDTIKHLHCWIDELGSTDEMKMDSVIFNNQTYLKYQLFNAYIFPYDTSGITIPEFNFKIISYKTKKSNLLIEREAYYLTFSSSSILIKLKPLPPHPLREVVPVGTYKHVDKFPNQVIKTDEMFKYSISIKGTKGLSVISNPILLENKSLEIFPPRITRKNAEVNNNQEYIKTFEYSIVPKKGDKIVLGDYIYWVYFNTKQKKYDTLATKLAVDIKEMAFDDQYQTTKHQSFYDQMIGKVSNKIKSKEKDDKIKWISNILILLMLVSTFILILKK